MGHRRERGALDPKSCYTCWMVRPTLARAQASKRAGDVGRGTCLVLRIGQRETPGQKIHLLGSHWTVGEWPLLLSRATRLEKKPRFRGLRIGGVICCARPGAKMEILDKIKDQP